MARTITIDLDSPDPTSACNAFLWAMHNARKLGFTPKTTHGLIEHLIKDEVAVMYYSSGSSIVSLVESRDLREDEQSFDDLMEVVSLMAEHRKRRRLRKEAQAAEIPPAEPAPAGVKVEVVG